MVLLKMLIHLMLIIILFADFEEPRSRLPIGSSPQSVALTETISPLWSSFLALAMQRKLKLTSRFGLHQNCPEVSTRLNITIAGYLKGEGSLWS